VIPAGYGTDEFDEEAALNPKLRATNAGFIVVTLEYDCPTIADLEECLAWTRGGDGDFERSRFAGVDRELCRFSEYRGYTIVFTGNRSLHFHLIFATKHLENAPWNCSAEERLSHAQSHSDLLNQAHSLYWDAAASIFDSLQPMLSPDRSTRTLTQWRRSPWAMRTLEKGSIVLGLDAGTLIPQVVIHENIRSRASRGSQGFLVPPDFRPRHAFPDKCHATNAPAGEVDLEALRDLLEERCRDEWGDYPRPVAVRHNGAAWVINFRNHPSDKKPSTIVMGSYRRLLLNGVHSLTRDFYLPDHLSADELCQSSIAGAEGADGNAASPLACASRLNSVALANWVDSYIDGIHSRFAEPLAGEERGGITSAYRQRLRRSISDARVFDQDLVIRSPEGMGKTSALYGEIASEIFDAALSRRPDQHEQFGCFAFRSNEQAEAKAEEYRRSGEYRKAVVLRGFWDHYGKACAAAGIKPLPQDEFPDHSPDGILREIKSRQPAVFEALEEQRRSLWMAPDGKNLFDSGSTVLFTNHDLAKLWYRSQITRLWHHPDFLPFANQDHEAMKADLTIPQIVFDEPEIDKLLHVIPESLFDWLARMNRQHPGWANLKRRERYEIYRTQNKAGEIPGKHSFEEIDELMRLKFDELEAQEVDYEAIPFGYDQPGKGIYSQQNGRRFYLGVQDWLTGCRARLTFLTTEALVSEALTRIFERKLATRHLIVLDLNAACGLFPIEVPLVIDQRAAADRPGNPKVTALANEILAANPSAVVIANAVEGPDPRRIKTFQRAKGLNNLNDNDVYVIVTCIPTEQYAELNVVGRWLAVPQVITRFYEDQISQAVGRNTGFRKSQKPTKTMLISSNRLARNVLAECFQDTSARIRLVRTNRQPGVGAWRKPISGDYVIYPDGSRQER
jgi:hypothetical protein